MLDGLFIGFTNMLSPSNLMACLIGCVAGTLVGVLPGLGPATTIAILFPMAFYLPPEQTLMIMAGIFYGAMYGGSTTSIVMNVPGEPASVVTCLDGYQMAKKGRAGPALFISAIGSFMAGTFGVVALSVIGPTLAGVALVFGPVERLGLFIFSLTCVAGLSGGGIGRGLLVCAMGMILAAVGIDGFTGMPRLTFGQLWLYSGFNVVAVIIGLFGASEVVFSIVEGVDSVASGRIKSFIPSREEWRPGLIGCVRGTIFGFVSGLLPGLVPAVTSFMAYDLEKRLSSHPERFGTGVIEGVAAPEAANNATSQAGFIPMLALGIPTGAAMAIVMAALNTYGIVPGPFMFTIHASLTWTFIASMYIGNVILLILNLPLVGLWARISLIPYRLLGPIVLGLCFIGSYVMRNSMQDVWVTLLFGVIGYHMRKRNWPNAPLILGFILGPLVEESLRQSLSITGGSPAAFLSHPIFIGLLVLTVFSIWLAYSMIRKLTLQEIESKTKS